MATRNMLLAFLVPITSSCSEPPAPPTLQASPVKAVSETVPVYTYEIVKTYPHDTRAYTQGLIWIPGGFYESCGLYNLSDVRKVNLEDGKPTKVQRVPDEFFAEGMTLWDGKLIQITWTTQRGFIYDAATFKKLKEWDYDGEGWGLTNDDKSLIMSDGTNIIRFLDPKTLKVQRVISVFQNNDPSRPYTELNELEYIKGEIWSNVWGTDWILRIDPSNGKLLGKIDFSGLLGSVPSDPDDVLNGIAYDAEHDRIFVTGKRWPKLFEVKIKRK